MSFSQEIQFKIALDLSKLASDSQKAVSLAQQAGQKMDAAFSGEATAVKLKKAANDELFKQLGTIDKIKSVTSELNSLVKARNGYEQGSKASMEAQLAIIQKTTQLETLRKQASKERLSGTPSLAGGGAPAETENLGSTLGTLVSGGMFKRLLFMGAGAIASSLLNAIPNYFQRKANESVSEEKTGERITTSLEDTAISKYGLSTEATITKRRAKDATEEIKTAKQTLKELEGESFFGKAYHQSAMILNSNYASVYEQLKQKIEDAKVKETEYANASELTQRALYKENTQLGIKSESLYQISKLQQEGKLSPVAIAGQNLADANAVLENIAKTRKNPTEIKEAENAVAQARINFETAMRSQIQQETSLKNQKDSLEQIANIQKQRKASAVEIAQIELDASKKAVSLSYRTGTPLERTAAENAQKQAQIAFNAAQDAQDNELLTIRNKRTAIEQTDKLQSKGNLNAISSAQIQLKLAKESVELAKIYGTVVDVNNAKAAQRQIESNLRATQMGMQQRQIDVSQSLTEQATEGRTFPNGRPRPLSETERLAKQARKARQQARDAVLTGAPGEAAYQQQRALGLEASVADRLSFGSSDMQKRITPDSTAIAAEITTTNQLLEAIKNSLTLTVN